MANWVENTNKKGYYTAVQWYNELVCFRHKYKSWNVANFRTSENRFILQNESGLSHSVYYSKRDTKLSDIFDINRTIDLTNTEYCINFNLDGKPSLFEKIKGTYILV